MKIEQTENSIKLKADTEWERATLLLLRQKTIASAKFEDDWNNTGYLELVFETHPWDKRR